MTSLALSVAYCITTPSLEQTLISDLRATPTPCLSRNHQGTIGWLGRYPRARQPACLPKREQMATDRVWTRGP